MASRTTLIGISGPSSSGKTTLSRLLRDILLSAGYKAFILHEDDFYVSDKDIPIHKETGFQDWDCLEAIDAIAFEAALKHITSTGELPEDLASKEDQNSVGKVEISDDLIDCLRAQASSLRLSRDRVIAIVDGFLLFTVELRPVYSLFDVRIFLPVSRDLMISRRSARSGYVTIEGFWEDPPGYVEKVVWPNYVKDHASLFINGDVEQEPDPAALNEMKLHTAPRSAMQDMNICLEWAWNLIETHLGGVS